MITSTTLPTFLQRIFLLCHLLNSLLLHLLPKKLSSLLLPLSCWLSPPPPTLASQESKKEPCHPYWDPFEPSTMAANPPSPSPDADAAAGADAAERRRVFQMFDRNGDGRITKKELRDSLENLGIFIPEQELSAMIQKIDVNGDGCVDVEEFGTLYETIMEEQDEEEDMREAFNVFDQNGDGFITVEELRSVLASLGLKQGRTVEDCKRMINKVDVDGDGMVNYKEFKQMMRRGGFAALS